MSEEATLDEFVEESDSNSNQPESRHKLRIGPFEYALPSNWDTASISEACENRDGERVPVKKSKRKEMNGDIPYYGASGQIDTVDDFLFDKCLLLLAEDGANLLDRNRPITYITEGETWVNNHAHVLEPKTGHNIWYLSNFLELLDYEPFVTGTAQPKLTQNSMGFLRVPKPPIEEQRKIAAILYMVDQAIEKTEEIIDQTEKLQKGIRQDVFSLGINASGGLRTDDANFKETYLGTVPEEWELQRVDEVCSDVVDCPHSTPEYTDKGILVVRTSEIDDGRFDPSEAPRVTKEGYKKRISRLEPEPGDVIFTREAPIGEAFKIPEGMKLCLGQRIMQLRPKNEVLDSDFLVELLYSDMMQNWFERSARGSTSKHINVEDMESLKLPIPSFAEQKRIDSILETYRQQLDSERRYLSRLQRLKQGLMQDLLSGTIRTTDTTIEIPDEIAQHG